MTIAESPELIPDLDPMNSSNINNGQWEHPRQAPQSPSFPPPTPHYLAAPGSTIDEDLRLRIVRTPTESLHEAAREDERRRIGKRKRKGTLRKTLFGPGSKLSRGFSVGGSSIKNPTSPTSEDAAAAAYPLGAIRPGTAGSTRPGTSGSAGGIASGLGMGLQSMGEFAQQLRDGQPQSLAGESSHRVQSPDGMYTSSIPTSAISTRTAGQEEEAKAEQFATPAIAEGESASTPGGLPTTSKSTSSNPLSSSSKRGGIRSFFTGSNRNDKKQAELRRRRNVYLNISLPFEELNKFGLPKNEYSRNKVRTSKYTIYTFLPKNLSEQFRRVANLYFLGLIVLQGESQSFLLEGLKGLEG